MHKFLIAWFGTDLLVIALFKMIYIVMPASVKDSINFIITIEFMFFIWIVVIKAYLFRQTIEIKKLNSYLLTLATLIVSNLPYQFVLLPYVQTAAQS
jgi:hypothetical protein